MPPANSYAAFDMVAIVASLGGVEALPVVLRALPADFPAAVTVCQHAGVGSPGALARILGRVSRLPVTYAEHGEPVSDGSMRPRRTSIFWSPATAAPSSPIARR